MRVELMEFGIYTRNAVISTITSVWRHPFLVCAMFGVIYMSRSYPYMFSLLVSASPVLVCTALLLGALLLSGQQNTPESEKEKRARYEEIARKNGMLYDANLDELNDRCYVERCSKSARDGVDSSLLEEKFDGDDAALCKEGNESKSGETWGASRELDGTMHQQSEWNEERLGDGAEMVDHYAIISKVIGELLESESEHEKSEEDCSDSDYDSGGENVNSSPNAQRHKDDEEEEEDAAAASDSGSERAESSSPDASMDVMMPILDELHPLLDEDAVLPVQMSRVGSDAALNEESPRSSSSISNSSIESGEETEVHGDDDEATKEDEAKSVITWTEEDQKNLMDVGSSEIERNQRLERILRRRKNMSMVPEINLMELENSDFQLNIAPISTARRNPFDLPDDANSPPGSAPSILSQRRMNPFDLPYDSSEWDQPSQQPRQPFLRRRDNFIARPSLIGPKGQERQPARFMPFFIQELTVSGESRYSSFQGESSGVSCGEGLEQQVGIGCSDGVLNRDPNQHSELDQVEGEVNGVEVDYDQGQSSKIMGFKLNEEEIM